MGRLSMLTSGDSVCKRCEIEHGSLKQFMYFNKAGHPYSGLVEYMYCDARGICKIQILNFGSYHSYCVSALRTWLHNLT